MAKVQHRSDIKKELMLKALKESYGVVTTASDACHVSRESHYKWLREDPEYARKVSEMEDIALDFAENALHKQIKEGNATSTIFYLKTKGKKRGYIERSEHIVETTESLANRMDYGQAERLLEKAGEPIVKQDPDLNADE